VVACWSHLGPGLDRTFDTVGVWGGWGGDPGVSVRARKPEQELDAFVAETAARLAAAPPVALAQTKTLLDEGADATLREALENEARAQTINFATEDAPAAFHGFLNKTDAVYTGRWAIH
jgi:enoyl-CoA hydratase/carnithine racemase